MKNNIARAIAVLLLLQSASAEETRIYRKQLEDIATLNGLSPREFSTAMAVATTWVYLGPCKGQNVPHASGALQWVAGMMPTSPTTAAIMEMITVLIRDTLGREPDAPICAFAKQVSEELASTLR